MNKNAGLKFAISEVQSAIKMPGLFEQTVDGLNLRLNDLKNRLEYRTKRTPVAQRRGRAF